MELEVLLESETNTWETKLASARMAQNRIAYMILEYVRDPSLA